MRNTRRTFLLGAGFSKAIAGGPTMGELWSWMEKRYEIEKLRKTSVDNLRVGRFEDLASNLNKMESIAVYRFQGLGNIGAPLRNNLEHVFTLIDLSLSAPEIEKDGSGLSCPSIIIPFSEDTLIGMKNDLQTYLYLALVELKSSSHTFASIIKNTDNFITFNYDLVLERLLWEVGLWSPLDGYVGICEFEKRNDKEDFVKSDRVSQLKIHKMHGSINWEERGTLERIIYQEDSLVIVMDDIERKDFYFNGIDKILARSPDTIDQGLPDQQYVGQHEPGWVLPSFIKPFSRIEFYNIWQSAIRTIAESSELVIIGYSFRPEDFISYLLISMLPKDGKITIIDPGAEDIKDRLENKTLSDIRTFLTLEKYIDSQ